MPPTSLHELFDLYRAENTDQNRLAGYKSVCSQIEEIKAGKQKLTADFVEQAWTAKNFGPAQINNGVLGLDEFKKAQSELTTLTTTIIESPTPETLYYVYEQLENLKRQGVLSWRPITITNRLMAACAPTIYTCAVYEAYYRPLHNALRNHYNLLINSGNWAEADSSMRRALVDYGLDNKDPYILNTFVWSLARKEQALAAANELETNRESVIAMDRAKSPLPNSLNTIFYGPPGTGKTRMAREILMDHFTERHIQQDQSLWEEDLVREAPWLTVIAAALMDTEPARVGQIMNHPLVQAKSRCSEGKTPNQTVSRTLQQHTPEDHPTIRTNYKYPPFVFDKEGNDRGAPWKLLPNWREEIPEAVDLHTVFHNGKPQAPYEEKRYACITFHQSYSYEEFVEGIRPVLAGDDDSEESGVQYILRNGVFKNICSKASADPGSKYAILIDEINRGNVSKIFGELITLIEESKRTGNEEELSVLLPYSNQPFSVPKNLYIFGTMNSADRSLALMDTALRRRFTFEHLAPDPSVLEGRIVDGIDLEALLGIMNERIEALYDKEHTIGHSYFLTIKNIGDLREVFQKKIIPLLEEYFFDDWEKIRLVLGDNQKESINRREYCFLIPDESWEKLFGPSTNGSQFAPRRRDNTSAMGNPKAYVAIYDLDAVREQ